MLRDRIYFALQIHLEMFSQVMEEPGKGFIKGEFLRKPLLQVTNNL